MRLGSEFFAQADTPAQRQPVTCRLSPNYALEIISNRIEEQLHGYDPPHRYPRGRKDAVVLSSFSLLGEIGNDRKSRRTRPTDSIIG